MALSKVLFLWIMLACLGLIMFDRKELSLLAMILVKSLYWVLQSPIGLKFLRFEALENLGIKKGKWYWL